jgi:hypothetical protein
MGILIENCDCVVLEGECDCKSKPSPLTIPRKRASVQCTFVRSQHSVAGNHRMPMP